MKLLLHIFLLLFFPLVALAVENKLPFKKEYLEKTYQLDNGNIIYIEQYERGDRIWEKDISTGEINNISFVWSFIALAKRCEGVEEKDIYFAANLEYYLGGGSKIDNPQIRVFSLHDPSPWVDSALGIVPNMDWTKNLCVFYDNKI